MPLSIIQCISHLAVPRPILVTDYWVIPTQNFQKFKSIHPKFDALIMVINYRLYQETSFKNFFSQG